MTTPPGATQAAAYEIVLGYVGAPVPAPDPHHYVRVEFDPGCTPSVTFECDAPEGARCRQTFACFLVGECDGEGGHHHEGCDPTLVDAGECNIANWINTDASVMGVGEIRLPVATEWTGDEYSFQPAVQPARRRRLAKMKAGSR